MFFEVWSIVKGIFELNIRRGGRIWCGCRALFRSQQHLALPRQELEEGIGAHSQMQSEVWSHLVWRVLDAKYECKPQFFLKFLGCFTGDYQFSTSLSYGGIGHPWIRTFVFQWYLRLPFGVIKHGLLENLPCHFMSPSLLFILPSYRSLPFPSGTSHPSIATAPRSMVVASCSS